MMIFIHGIRIYNVVSSLPDPVGLLLAGRGIHLAQSSNRHDSRDMIEAVNNGKGVELLRYKDLLQPHQ